MANYNVGNIEIGVITSSKNVVSNLDVIINKLKDFKKIDKGLKSIFVSINNLANGFEKISKINIDNLSKNLESVINSSKLFNEQLSKINPSSGFVETSKSINQLLNGLNKINKINLKNIDFKSLNVYFNSLTNTIDPFISKIKNAEPSLKAFVNALDLGKINASLLVAEARIKAINSNAQNKEVINNINIQKANANLQKTQLNVEKAKVQLEKANLQLDKMKNKSSNVSANFSNLINVGKIYFLFNYSKRIVGGIAKMVSYASDYAEILNKFQVSFGSIYEDNLKSVNQLSEAFGFSTNTLMDYTATFNNMLQSLGNLSDKANAEISQSLTRMAIDYSSLFNVSIQRAMETFQSAISGNIRTLRSISGFDVSEITIFSIYQELGGTKSMRQLNQLEKRLLRIIAIQRQMGETGAVGDYGRTINCGFDKKLSNELFVNTSKSGVINNYVYC